METSLTQPTVRGGEVRGDLIREQQDADGEDDRDDAGHVHPQWQERGTALVYAVAPNPVGVLDRDPALTLLDEDDHEDDHQADDAEGEQLEPVGAGQELADRGRDSRHDAGEDDEADAVADPLLGDQLAQPHQDDGAGRESQDHGQALVLLEAERHGVGRDAAGGSVAWT